MTFRVGIALIFLFILEGCPSSQTMESLRGGAMDNGQPLPIKLAQYSVIDTSIVLAGPQPIDTVFDPAQVDLEHQTPLPRVTVGPRYPEPLRRNGIQGTVWIKALITPDGDVSQAEIMKTDHEGFNQAALRAVIQWKFPPAPARWVAIPFRFRLNP
jgi:periplasmic protein TonB